MPKSDAELAAPHFQHPQPQKSTPATGQVDTGEVSTPDQLQDLTNRIQALETTARGRVVFNTGLIGLYETVTAIPTTGTTANNPKGVPLSPYDQVKIYNGKLYFYDAVNRAWDVAGGSSVFAGAVTSGATAGSPFPSGWTVASGGTGVYTVTHNLGTTAYSVVATGTGAFSYGNIPGVTNISSNSFQVTMGTIGVGGSVSPTANPFDFILSM